MTRNFYNREISINSNSKSLAGNLFIPSDAKGVVIFVHGSGSSRFSPRNKSVAQVLQESNIATLLFDLLTQKEEEEERWTAHIRFNIPLLAKRLVDVTEWIRENPNTKNLPIGYFGASTGAAAALVAAGQSNDRVKAIVSRGGRPDLAYDDLFNVRVPTLLIVGERDDQVIELNQIAFEKLIQVKEKKIIIVPKATHLFEETGTLEQVSVHAVKWFLKYLNL
ncbi:MAG: dienelactone hydrolase family protein [Nitrososphaeraceae archaeon]|nr:dienelactone hydrolase family protein [Nitrososphaeraceae archaeon]